MLVSIYSSEILLISLQTCVSANRFLIEESVFDAFVNKLKTAMDTELKQGVGESCNTGPLINVNQLQRVSQCLFLNAP